MPAYLYDLSKLASEASTGRVDHITDFLSLALAERIEALAAQLAATTGQMAAHLLLMNERLAALDTGLQVKIDKLAEATKQRPP